MHKLTLRYEIPEVKVVVATVMVTCGGEWIELRAAEDGLYKIDGDTDLCPLEDATRIATEIVIRNAHKRAAVNAARELAGETTTTAATDRHLPEPF